MAKYIIRFNRHDKDGNIMLDKSPSLNFASTDAVTIAKKCFEMGHSQVYDSITIIKKCRLFEDE